MCVQQDTIFNKTENWCSSSHPEIDHVSFKNLSDLERDKPKNTPLKSSSKKNIVIELIFLT